MTGLIATMGAQYGDEEGVDCGGSCESDCSTCGDAVIEGNEQCDDGMNDGTAGCFECRLVGSDYCEQTSCYAPFTVHAQSYAAGVTTEIKIPRLKRRFMDWGLSDASADVMVASVIRATNGQPGTVHVYEKVDGNWCKQHVCCPMMIPVTKTLGMTLPFRVTISSLERPWMILDRARRCLCISKENDTWVQMAKLASPEVGWYDRFGHSVDVLAARSSWGLAMMTMMDLLRGMYVFSLVNGARLQSARLSPATPQEQAIFGESVAVENNVIAIGGRGFETNGVAAGAVHVYEFINNDWFETARLAPEDGGNADEFGTDVAISQDRLVIGAKTNSGANALGGISGAAYIYQRKASPGH